MWCEAAARGERKSLWHKEIKFFHFMLDWGYRICDNTAMKQKANTAKISKTSTGYQATIKQGRSTQSFSFASFNSARSFVRRNFKQIGSYNN